MRTTSDFFDQAAESFDDSKPVFVPRPTVPLYQNKLSSTKADKYAKIPSTPFFSKSVPSLPQSTPALEQIQLAIQKEVSDLKQNKPNLDQIIQNALRQKAQLQQAQQKKLVTIPKRPQPVTPVPKATQPIVPFVPQIKNQPPRLTSPQIIPPTIIDPVKMQPVMPIIKSPPPQPEAKPVIRLAPKAVATAPIISKLPQATPLKSFAVKPTPATVPITPAKPSKPFQQPSKDLWWPDQPKTNFAPKIITPPPVVPNPPLAPKPQKPAASSIFPVDEKETDVIRIEVKDDKLVTLGPGMTQPEVTDTKTNLAPIAAGSKNTPKNVLVQTTRLPKTKADEASPFHISTNIISYFLFGISQQSDPYHDGTRQKIIYAVKLGAYLIALGGVFEFSRIIASGFDFNGMLEVGSILLISGILFFFGENINILFQPHNPYQIHEVV